MVKKTRFLFLVAFLTAALIALPARALAADTRVYDYADLFTSSEEAALEEDAADFRDKTGYDFVVLTSEDAPYGDSHSLEYADDFYDQNGFGTGTDKSGILFFIDMNNRLPTISTCGAMIDYIDDTRLDALLDLAYDHLSDGDWAGAAEAVINKAQQYVASGISEGQYRYDSVTGEILTGVYKKLTVGEIAASVAAGAVVALLCGASVKAGYRIRKRRSVYSPAGNSALKIMNRTDRYLRTAVVTHRNMPPPGAMGGGGTGRGSSVHTSSGGMSHGGGSGRHF